MRKVYNWYYDMALQIVPFAIAGSALTASGYLTPQDTIHAILSFGAAGTAGWPTRAMFLRTMLIAMNILPGYTFDVTRWQWRRVGNAFQADPVFSQASVAN